ncbi:MAG: hypothetical protein ACK56I_33195, partial [bacterium]
VWQTLQVGPESSFAGIQPLQLQVIGKARREHPLVERRGISKRLDSQFEATGLGDFHLLLRVGFGRAPQHDGLPFQFRSLAVDGSHLFGGFSPGLGGLFLSLGLLLGNQLFGFDFDPFGLQFDCPFLLTQIGFNLGG